MANGQKKGFTREQLAQLRDALTLLRDYQGLALLNVGVDSMLRCSDYGATIWMRTARQSGWESTVG